MPSAESILAGLTTIANQWRSLAVFWHGYFALLLLAIAAHRGLSTRLIAILLVLPLVSVSALAWISHNPFNGVLCAALSLALLMIGRRLPSEAVAIGSRWLVLVGVALITFGCTYPHFLQARHWEEYLIAAPLGLVPCPTLSALAGVTLVTDGLHSRAWALLLGGAASFYAAIGVFGLSVVIDLVLFAGAATLVIVTLQPTFPQGLRT